MGPEKVEKQLAVKFLATFLIGGVVVGVSLFVLYSGGVLPTQNLSPLAIWRRRKRKKPIRVYMDGCFDMMHYGHCNALRQARALGDELVVGVVSDAEIIANKGPPVTPLNERLCIFCINCGICLIFYMIFFLYNFFHFK